MLQLEHGVVRQRWKRRNQTELIKLARRSVSFSLKYKYEADYFFLPFFMAEIKGVLSLNLGKGSLQKGFIIANCRIIPIQGLALHSAMK